MAFVNAFFPADQFCGLLGSLSPYPGEKSEFSLFKAMQVRSLTVAMVTPFDAFEGVLACSCLPASRAPTSRDDPYP